MPELLNARNSLWWATWLVCRNGSAQRQNRGYAFRKAFLDVESRLRGAPKHIHNIPL